MMLAENPTRENCFDEDVVEMVQRPIEVNQKKQLEYTRIMENEYKLMQFCRMLCKEMQLPREKWK